jgi:hypothetical protein
MRNNVVEILYTDACPFWKETLKTINEFLKELNITITVKKTRIADEEEGNITSFQAHPQSA